MPRNPGTGQYARPVGTDAVTDTTIESTKYNANVADVEQDLNLPRPIVAGGTGAASAGQALVNLSGETAAQIVTNWDSQLWAPGSFYAATTATGIAPVVGHKFAGICYINEPLAYPPTNQNLVCEATDITDPLNLVSYIRVMTAGVWSAWSRTGSSGTSGSQIGDYLFDTTITFPPASGQIRFNNTVQNSTTEIFISHLTSSSIDVTTTLPFYLRSGYDIAIHDAKDVTKYKIFTITADPILSGGDIRMTVKFKVAGADHVATKHVLVGASEGQSVRYDTAQTLTDNQQTQARANIGVLEKNFIINGAMQVTQENSTTAGTSEVYYPVDQFFMSRNTTGTATIAQVYSATPSGSLTRIRLTATVADAALGATDWCVIAHNLEGYRVAELGAGTGSPKNITVRFGVKAPAGTYCLCFANGTSNRNYIAEYVIAPGEANTDVIKTITITLDNTGTWAIGNTKGLSVVWSLMCGSTYQGTPGSWVATGGTIFGSPNQINFMATAGNVFELFDVSLTEGNAAPGFVVQDYATDLAACQRYWWRSGFIVDVNTACQSITYPTSMRASPAITGGAAGFAIATIDTNSVLYYQTARTIQTLSFNARL